MKFCFLCGKKTEDLIEGYCQECYNKEFNLIDVPKEITFTVCSKCGRIRHRNKWQDIGVEDLLKDKVKIKGNKVSLRIKVNDNMHVVARGYLKGSKKVKEEEHIVYLKPIKKVCQDCSRRTGGYVEAIVQLRGKSAKAMDFIEDQMIRENQTFRVENVKNGLDIYLADKNFADRMTNRLKKKFNAKIKKNYKLVTRKKGKNIYRSVILVRID
jgi:nonsense-mediated mRNA decay protein 3